MRREGVLREDKEQFTPPPETPTTPEVLVEAHQRLRSLSEAAAAKTDTTRRKTALERALLHANVSNEQKAMFGDIPTQTTEAEQAEVDAFEQQISSAKKGFFSKLGSIVRAIAHRVHPPAAREALQPGLIRRAGNIAAGALEATPRISSAAASDTVSEAVTAKRTAEENKMVAKGEKRMAKEVTLAKKRDAAQDEADALVYAKNELHDMLYQKKIKKIEKKNQAEEDKELTQLRKGTIKTTETTPPKAKARKEKSEPTNKADLINSWIEEELGPPLDIKEQIRIILARHPQESTPVTKEPTPRKKRAVTREIDSEEETTPSAPQATKRKSRRGSSRRHTVTAADIVSEELAPTIARDGTSDSIDRGPKLQQTVTPETEAFVREAFTGPDSFQLDENFNIIEPTPAQQPDEDASHAA